MSQSTGNHEQSRLSKDSKERFSFVKADPAFINQNWAVLQVELAFMMLDEESVQPTLGRLNNLLEGFMSGWLTLWLVMADEVKIRGWLVTTLGIGGPAGSKALYVMYMKLNETVPLQVWEDALERLKEFARLHGCNAVVAVVDIPKLARLYERLGAIKQDRLVWRLDHE